MRKSGKVGGHVEAGGGRYREASIVRRRSTAATLEALAKANTID